MLVARHSLKACWLCNSHGDVANGFFFCVYLKQCAVCSITFFGQFAQEGVPPLLAFS